MLMTGDVACWEQRSYEEQNWVCLTCDPWIGNITEEANSWVASRESKKVLLHDSHVLSLWPPCQSMQIWADGYHCAELMRERWREGEQIKTISSRVHILAPYVPGASEQSTTVKIAVTYHRTMNRCRLSPSITAKCSSFRNCVST